MGAVTLAGSAVALWLGAPALPLVLALALGRLAAFVAATAVRVPSIVATTLVGRARASAPGRPVASPPTVIVGPAHCGPGPHEQEASTP